MTFNLKPYSKLYPLQYLRGDGFLRSLNPPVTSFPPPQSPKTLFSRSPLKTLTMANDDVSNGPSPSPRAQMEEAPTKAPIAYTPYTLETTLTGHRGAVSAVKFSPDGRLLASSSADGTLRLYSAADSSYPLICELAPSTGPGSGLSDLSFSDGSRLIAAASDDRTVRMWDLESQTQIKTLTGHTNYVFCCAFNPQSNMLASGSFDETVRVWEVRSGRCLRVLPAHSEPVTSVDFNMDGSMIVSSSYDGLCRVWDSATGHCMKTLVDDDSPPVSFAKFSPNGKFVLTSTLDSTLRLWNFSAGKYVKTYKGHTNTKYCIPATFCVTREKYVVSGSEDSCVYLWDLQTRKIVQKLEGHTNTVISVSCHPEQSIIASGALGPDKSVKVWVQKEEEEQEN